MTGASLEGLQGAIQSALRDSGAHFKGVIRSGGPLDADARLAIYRIAYRARLVDALRDLHGHAAAYLGEDAFVEAAETFVAAQPSIHANLRWYGEGFASWLSASMSSRPEVAELARLDRALRAAFDGPDAGVLTVGDLAGVLPGDWSRIAFMLQPTFARCRFMHNTLALWQAIDHDEVAPPVVAYELPVEVVIWRRGLQPHFRSLGAFEAKALDLMHAGSGFAASCAQLAADFPQADVATEAGMLLRRWIDEELLASLRPGTSAQPPTQMISK